MSTDQGLAEALYVIRSTVRHAKAAICAHDGDSTAMSHAIMCLRRDVMALERIGRRLEAGEIARSKITLGDLT